MNFTRRKPMDDPETARVTRLRELQKQKAAALAEFLPRWRAAVARAEELERGIKAAEEAVEEAIRAYTSACLARAAINQQHQQLLARIEPQMRELRDPLIDAFRAEIDERLVETGKIPIAAGDTAKHKKVHDLQQHLLFLRDECDRLEVSERITDVAGYIAQLRAGIPTV